MGECDSTFLKSRTPRITVLDNYCYPPVENLQCPIRKGIIYYSRGSTLFERNIYRSSKHEPRILGSGKSPASTELLFFKLIPIESNRVLLMRVNGFRNFNSAQHGTLVERSDEEELDIRTRPGPEHLARRILLHDKVSHLELSIHEIFHYRLGSALWTYHRDSDKQDLNDLLKPLRSLTDILGNTFDKSCISQMKLLAMNHEAGPLHFHFLVGEKPGANSACSPDGRIFGVRLDEEVVAMSHSLSSANAGFDFITQLPIPSPHIRAPRLPPAFSADGSKFAVIARDGAAFVWDVRNKIPLMRKERSRHGHRLHSLHFSSGTLGRGVLAFTKHMRFIDNIIRIHLIESTSFQIEETFDFEFPPVWKRNRWALGWSSVSFDPDGEMMYVVWDGTLYEWKLRAREQGPEWWLGEE